MNAKVYPSENKKLSKKRNLKWFIAIGSILFIGALVSIIYYFSSRTKTQTDTNRDEIDCAIGHEQYQLSSDSLLGKYRRAAIAVDSSTCATEGKKILELNGSAVDAAIVTGLCDGLLNPQSMGIGGGHFMLIYLKSERKVVGIDSREVAPMKSSETMFVNQSGLSLKSGLASGIPGEIAGYWLAHQKYGRLPWKRLIEPIIELCLNGIKISRAFSNAMQQYEKTIEQESGLASIFLNPATGKIFKENDTIRYVKLAKTLNTISINGSKSFYDGQLSKIIVQENNMNNGIMTVDDLKEYRPIEREPIRLRLDSGLTIYTMPPPSSGVLVTFILGIMQKFDYLSGNEALTYHRLIESFKHAFAKRSFLGDSSFINVTSLVRNLTSDLYINEIHKLIDDYQTYNTSYYGPSWSGKSDHGTAHISVLDHEGNAVSLTCTINTFFGAKYAGLETGIIYNNEMDDFSTPGTINTFNVPASQANFISPGKRPMSSMSPIIVIDKNDNVRLVLGASGGTKIISAVSYVALHNLWLGYNIKESIDKLRLHHQLSPHLVDVEKGFPSEIQEMLKMKGHKLQCFNYGGSTVQGIERREQENGELWANSDARKGGTTDGF